MKVFLRCPPLSVAALTVYFLVNVVAAASHHHQGATAGLQEGASACRGSLEFRTSDTPEHDDPEETCLLCKVLHLPSIAAPASHADAFPDLVGEASVTAPPCSPRLL